ncbi:hypothetical protein AB0J83_35000 [Actinoplanes sp. NPDC049596]|uniref:hypothetical protein n=1 Tax=unclassified Actinoplanes TaxID=2626549 RepID=UPI00341593C5
MSHVFAALALVAGVAAFLYGEADDSPGLQLLAVLLVLGVVAVVVRRARRRT